MSIERLHLRCELSFDDKTVIKPIHKNFYLILAVLQRYFAVVDPETKRDLEKCALSAYFKVTVPNSKRCEEYGLDTTAVATVDDQYFRCTDTPTFDLLMQNTIKFPEFQGVSANELIPVANRLFSRVVARELDLREVDAFASYAALLDQLVDEAKQGKFPENIVAIDFSRLLRSSGMLPHACAQKLEEITQAKIAGSDAKLKEKIAPWAFIERQGQEFFYAPYCVTDDKTKKTYFQMLSDWMIRSQGYRLSPDEMWRALLQSSDCATLQSQLGLARVELAVQIPHVVTSLQQFLQQQSVKEFTGLSANDQAAPYLQVYPEMVTTLLQGFHNLDQVFKNRKIEPLLHDSYFLLQRSMEEATRNKTNMVSFINQIEFIRQIMRVMLSIAKPYSAKDLVDSTIFRLGHIVPQNFDRPLVHLRRGAMAGIAHVLDAIEQQKGHNLLGVAIHKDSYHRIADNMFERIQTYTTSVLDTESGLLSPVSERKIDLFVCEFNHNANKERHHYFQENILLQFKDLHQKKQLADKCTILIDNTIDLDDSAALAEFLHDPLIKRLYAEGALNVVLLRSAQKLDMFGMDDDFGGITTVFNKETSFEAFNARMNRTEDHLTGLEFQSITHNQKHGAKTLDKIRRAWIQNTKFVLEQIKELSPLSFGSSNPMQVSTMEGNRSFFIHVEFPEFSEAEKAFWDTVDTFSRQNKGIFLRRPSFSYPYTTAYLYRKRFNIGLEDKANLTWFAKYISHIQQIINELGPKCNDAELAKRIRALVADPNS